MSILKGFGSLLIALVGAAAFGLLIYALIYGVGMASAFAMPLMAWVVQIAFLICLLLLPLSIFHRVRIVAAHGFLLSSYAFGLCTWMLGLLVTLQFWGVIAVVIGVFLAGVGVVPIGMLASAFHGSWSNVVGLLIGLILTYFSRFFALWIGEKYEAEESRRRLKIIEGEVLR